MMKINLKISFKSCLLILTIKLNLKQFYWFSIIYNSVQFFLCLNVTLFINIH